MCKRNCRRAFISAGQAQDTALDTRTRRRSHCAWRATPRIRLRWCRWGILPLLLRWCCTSDTPACARRACCEPGVSRTQEDLLLPSTCCALFVSQLHASSQAEDPILSLMKLRHPTVPIVCWGEAAREQHFRAAMHATPVTQVRCLRAMHAPQATQRERTSPASRAATSSW